MLGQHSLVSSDIAELIIHSAEIRKSDSVLEIGTGTCTLTKLIAPLASQVITYEIDSRLAQEARRSLSNFRNVKVVSADAFAMVTDNDIFDHWITSLPYSRSLDFVELISRHAGGFQNAVAVVQRDFASKLVAEPGSRAYRSVSVLAQSSFTIEKIGEIPPNAFSPAPKVVSTILKFVPINAAKRAFFDKGRIALLKRIFSFRGRVLRNASKEMQLGFEMSSEFDRSLLDRRIERLEAVDFLYILGAAKLGHD
jgi:16S rRNA (adenine1518-N6/adenine1519-N6)-dimethyltransferase